MKAMLVIDMPRDCSECELRGFDNETDDPVCWINGFPCNYSATLNLCPLRPLPDQFDENRKYYDCGYAAGWKDCAADARHWGDAEHD